MDAGFSAMSSSLYGLRRSLDALRREAHTVARGVVDGAGADLTGALVRSTAQKQAAEANAAALRRNDQRLGSRLDVLV